MPEMNTYDEWIEKLKNKDFQWLLKQTHPGINGHNGVNFTNALRFVIETKIAEGESMYEDRVITRKVHTECDDDDEFVIVHEKSGPKGMTERVRVPKDVFSG